MVEGESRGGVQRTVMLSLSEAMRTKAEDCARRENKTLEDFITEAITEKLTKAGQIPPQVF